MKRILGMPPLRHGRPYRVVQPAVGLLMLLLALLALAGGPTRVLAQADPTNTLIPLTPLPVPPTATATEVAATPTWTPRPFTPLPTLIAAPPTFTALPSDTPTVAPPTATTVPPSATPQPSSTTAPTNTPFPTAAPLPPTDTPEPANREPRKNVENTAPAPANPALGAGSASLSGAVTLHGAGAAGVRLELHSKTAAGVDTMVADTMTAADGSYSFANLATTPDGGSYYVFYPGGRDGTLASWYTAALTVGAGDHGSVAAFDIADVRYTLGSNTTLSLPAALSWDNRDSRDSYTVRIYSGDRQVLDSGDLGHFAGYTLASGALTDGSYSALVLISSANGYGKAATQISFRVAAAPTSTPPPPPLTLAPAPTSTPAPAATTAPVQSSGLPNDLRLSMAADRAEAGPGSVVIYTIELLNAGANALTNVVLTDPIPTGLAVDANLSRSERGTLGLQNRIFSVTVGTLQPGERVQVRLVVGVTGGGAINNSARVTSDQTPLGISSNMVSLNAASGQTQSVAVPTAPSDTSAPPAAVPTSSAPLAAPTETPAAPAATATKAPAQPTATRAAQRPEATPTLIMDYGLGEAPTEDASGNIQQVGGLLPTTGAELPLISLLLLAVLIAVRQLRVWRAKSSR